MSANKRLLTILIVLLNLTAAAQILNLPSSEIIKKEKVRMIRVAHFWGHRPGSDGSTTYRFNKSGLLTKEKQNRVNYTYRYDSKGRLIAVAARWKFFSHAWIEGQKHQCTCMKYEENSVLIAEYVGKCKRALKDKLPVMKLMRSYRDAEGRDTLLRTLQNNWYYTTPADTGHSRTIYPELVSNTPGIAMIVRYQDKSRVEKLLITSDSLGRVIEINTHGGGTCNRQTLEYSGSLLSKINYFDCLNNVNTFEKYHYRRRGF